jgi:hypothetical protein
MADSLFQASEPSTLNTQLSSSSAGRAQLNRYPDSRPEPRSRLPAARHAYQHAALQWRLGVCSLLQWRNRPRFSRGSLTFDCDTKRTRVRTFKEHHVVTPDGKNLQEHSGKTFLPGTRRGARGARNCRSQRTEGRGQKSEVSARGKEQEKPNACDPENVTRGTWHMTLVTCNQRQPEFLRSIFSESSVA